MLAISEILTSETPSGKMKGTVKGSVKAAFPAKGNSPPAIILIDDHNEEKFKLWKFDGNLPGKGAVVELTGVFSLSEYKGKVSINANEIESLKMTNGSKPLPAATGNGGNYGNRTAHDYTAMVTSYAKDIAVAALHTQKPEDLPRDEKHGVLVAVCKESALCAVAMFENVHGHLKKYIEGDKDGS